MNFPSNGVATTARRRAAWRPRRATAWAFAAASILLVAFAASLQAQTLPGTAKIEWDEEDLSARLMDGAHRFVERKIAESEPKRAAHWRRDFSSTEAYLKSVSGNRGRLREFLGTVDARPKPLMERYGDDANLALVAETPHYRVFQVRWPALEGVWGCGLLVEPTAIVKKATADAKATENAKTPTAHVIVLPDADQTPEQLLGLAPGVKPESQLARWLAENGVTVVIPVTISRSKLVTDDEQLRRSDQTHREWIYRQAFHMGRHVIGYEAQIVMAAVDWLKAKHGPATKVGLCGHAEGGLVALHTAALDERVDATLVSGYFSNRQHVWSEPIYRNVWSLLREFGDAEIAGLILPRGLVIEHSPVPEITGHKGDWRTPEFATVKSEFERIATGPDWRPTLVKSDERPYSEAATTAFAALLGVPGLSPLSGDLPTDRRAAFSATDRHERLFRELEGHVQRLIHRSDKVREAAFPNAIQPELATSRWSTEANHPTLDPANFIEKSKSFRERFHTEAMGRFDEPRLPFNARTRVVATTDKWTAWDVVLDVSPELFAWGLLVVPKEMKPGERRPVVVCQHGRQGVPRDLLDRNNSAYNNAAAALAERGFVTFAPHNLYRGEDRYRWLDRKANTIQATLFSFIIDQHDQILKWLQTQPFVDPDRIAFYGLSYGGETAVRVPPILERYCLSICSGDFNQWTRKVASTDEPFSFMRTIEWEMPYWNLGQTFDYAEMAYLMLPRPFMVERGHHDRVGRDHWVAYEYAKVRRLYAQFGVADRTTIEFFQGGHSMRLEGAVDFLHQHLRWPKPATRSP